MFEYSKSNHDRRVAILLCTRTGETFLTEQLNSIEGQTHPNWQVWASDDGSTDRTLYLLEQYRQRWRDQRLTIVAGPGRGASANFMSLVCHQEIEADYFAFCDQDDVWDADKLAVALPFLDSAESSMPTLYCGRTRLIDDGGSVIGESPLFRKPPTFENALVQSLGGGNTMLFNRSARELLAQSARLSPIENHDWWAYLLIVGCGGRVVYDPTPHVAYRQHDSNVMGRNSGWNALQFRLKGLLQDRFKDWNDINERALEAMQSHLTPSSLQTFLRFRSARKQGLIERLRGLSQAKVHRQTLLGNLGLGLAALTGKI